MTRYLILFLVIACSGCVAPVNLNEPELRQHILGSWLYSENDPPVNFRQWFTFEPDGTGTFGNGGGCLAGEGKGSWELSGNTLHVKVAGVDDFLANIDIHYEILSITSQRLTVKNLLDGKIYVFNRKKL